MATVNKNFRIKNGLIVEGSTATVNGQNVLTETGSDNYIINLIGGTATSANEANKVVKRDGSGNFSAGTITADLVGNVTGTVSSLSNHDTDDLAEGSSNQYFTAQRVKDILTGADKTNISITEVNGTLTITAENGVGDSTTDDLTEGSTNKYFTNQRALDATAAAYDAAGAASAAQTAAQSYADGVAATAQSNAEDYADSLAGNYDAAGAASSAEAAANTYTDGKISTEVTDRNNAISSAISTEVTNRNSAISTAISGEVTDRNSAIATAKSEAISEAGFEPQLRNQQYEYRELPADIEEQVIAY